MNQKRATLFVCSVFLLFICCKKPNTTNPAGNGPQTNAASVLNSEVNTVIVPTYGLLANDASLLYNQALLLQSSPTSQNLLNCRQQWLNTTADYEQSCSTLFGPNGSIGADPASLINTYPIDTAGINTIINSAAVFTLVYIDSLPSYLTGFHGMEFELYGATGNKTAAQFTSQQLSYITAVALNIKTLTSQIDSEWSGPFQYQFTNAGNGSTVYTTQRAAFSDFTMGIANITETDAIYKLNAILSNKSTILQESPFANNSVTDIMNNLIGVRNIYYGQYANVTGTGLTVFVRQNAENLDIKIKNDLNTAINAVGSITLPLSQAIYSQTTQINAAMNACDSLDDDLKVDLLTYMNANTN
jgi:putative iron-regulated protein